MVHLLHRLYGVDAHGYTVETAKHILKLFPP